MVISEASKKKQKVVVKLSDNEVDISSSSSSSSSPSLTSVDQYQVNNLNNYLVPKNNNVWVTKTQESRLEFESLDS